MTALYCRLSRDDGTQDESSSIQTQKAILSKYASDHGYWNTRFFVDDGYSGTNFNRPAFQELISEVKANRVERVITKDLIGWLNIPNTVIDYPVVQTRDFPYHTVTEIHNNAEYKTFFDSCKPYADWMAGDLPTYYPTMLMTLSTCEYSKKNSRLVVVCACTKEKENRPQSP